MHSIGQVLGYTVAGLAFIAGGLILSGYMVPVFIQTERFRVLFGIVVVLFGVFRFVSAYFSGQRERRLIEDDSWKNSSSESSSP